MTQIKAVNMDRQTFPNPFRPGAGHMPPYLAGRTAEMDEFKSFLGQTTVIDNLILTGLRGVGKTVPPSDARTNRKASGLAVDRNRHVWACQHVGRAHGRPFGD